MCPLRYITQDVWDLIEDVVLSGGRIGVQERHELPAPYHQAFMAAWSERRAREAAMSADAARRSR